MKRGYFSGWWTVFKFTLLRHIKTKSYITLTVIVSILFLGIVFGIMIIPNLNDDNEGELTETSLRSVIICDETGVIDDVSWLSSGDSELYANVEYTTSATLDDAFATADEYTLVLSVTKADDLYDITVISPDEKELTSAEISAFTQYVSNLFRSKLIISSGIDPSILSELISPISTETSDTDMIEENPIEHTREIFAMVLSYIVIFVIYMMVVFFGQGAASNVILEKTSKLMDFFLVSVKPAAMILGKVLATATAAFIQVTVWVAGAVCGFSIGKFVITEYFPSSDTYEFINSLSGLKGMFNPSGIVIALLIIIAGFLLYCSLAAIGGAMASKPEDLASTNIIFTMAVVLSFLLSIYSGSSSGMVSTEKWLIYFPFTAILVTPGRAMTGGITIIEGAVSVVLVAICALVGIILAGRVYEMMSFYRGNPPTPVKIFSMIRDSLKSKKADNNL